MKRFAILVVALLFSLHAQADGAATGKAIEQALNQRDLDAVMRAMDIEAVTRLVLKDLGLNAKDREAIGQAFPRALRNNVEIGVRSLESSEGSARYLRSGTRNGKPYALVRYDLGDNGTDYVEYYLTPSGKVEDWYAHSMANLYSTSAALGLATVFKTDSMLFSLFGLRVASEADAKPFAALRERLQAQDFAGAYRVLESMPEAFRRTRHWALLRVTYGGRID